MRAVTTPAARDDVLRQFRYYAVEQGVPDVALRFLDAVEAAVARIRDLPAVGSPQSFDAPELKGLRAWPVPGFKDIRLYYLEVNASVVIVRVLHDNRDVGRNLETDTPLS